MTNQGQLTYFHFFLERECVRKENYLERDIEVIRREIKLIRFLKIFFPPKIRNDMIKFYFTAELLNIYG